MHGQAARIVVSRQREAAAGIDAVMDRTRGEHLRFAREAGDAIDVEHEGGGQHLECDVAVQLRVLRAIHLAHSAGAQRADDFVGANT